MGAVSKNSSTPPSAHNGEPTYVLSTVSRNTQTLSRMILDTSDTGVSLLVSSAWLSPPCTFTCEHKLSPEANSSKSSPWESPELQPLLTCLCLPELDECGSKKFQEPSHQSTGADMLTGSSPPHSCFGISWLLQEHQMMKSQWLSSWTCS